MNFSIVSLNIGKVSKLKAGAKILDSGFRKHSVNSAYLSDSGFDGDEQADLKHHGGLDKAICVFSMHHCESFSNLLGKELSIPAFGENFSVNKADEKEIYLGDVFQCGEVKVQVSQPRQPCLKAGAFHENNSVIKHMTEKGSTGFYLRVLSVGTVKKDDVFERLESDEKFSLATANDIMYRRETSLEKLKELIEYKYLSKAWKVELGLRLKKLVK